LSIDKGEKLNRLQERTIAAALLVVTAVATACGGSSSANGAATTKINLVAYSTPEASYKELIPAFAKTGAGKGAEFTQSYGASGDQSKAVEAGQAADVVHFALQPDIQRLVDAGKVSSSWDDGPQHGIVADTEVVFAVRQGNPKAIHTWDDLVKPGVEVITPNPFSSGGARWNIMAAYGAEIDEGKTPDQAEAYLSDLFHHVPVQDDKASASLTTFTGGKGDVLLAYEQDALAAQAAGEDLEIVYPPQTILIQTPIAVTKGAPPIAKKFVDWLFKPQAQNILAETGYRSVLPSVEARCASKYPDTSQTFTIDDVGGWDKVMADFFDPEHSVMQQIEMSLGVSTS
jgi:sulfate/thiosulfate transport system substrate-binding protein